MARAPRKSSDPIEHFLQEWRRERPDLDSSSFAVFGRIYWMHGLFQRRAEKWLGEMGLTWESFSLIVTLRRSGHPFALRPLDLLSESLLTSGAMTNRITRVEGMGLVRRIRDPNDRRGVIVALTSAGRSLANRAIKRHFAAMEQMLAELEPDEKRTLRCLLSKLLISMEKSKQSRKKVIGQRALARLLDAQQNEGGQRSRWPRRRSQADTS
jgi:DNA-binding MarR family transcriptional regulator